MEHRVNRRVAVALPVAITLAGLASSERAVARNATPVAGMSSDWPLYGQNLSGDKAASESRLTVSTVGSLVPLWQVEVGGLISATPVIADGVVYVGSYDGNLYALDLRTGGVRWRYATGAAVLEPNLKIPLGITGSAAIIGDTVYAGDATATVHAVDVATGKVRWMMKVDDQPQASICSSPVVSQEKVYIGVASVAKEVGFRGSVVALDAATGKIVWQTYMVPEGADGAGVFAVPAIEEQRGWLYVGTQNAYIANPAPYGNPTSVVALDIVSGEVKWAFNAPPGGGNTAPTDDVAFSASPNLFSAEIGGRQRDLVGEGQKSGVYWAVDRDTGDVVWKATVSPAGFLGGMEGTSAVGNGMIAVPATNWSDPNGPAAGMVTGLDAATGKAVWSAETDRSRCVARGDLERSRFPRRARWNPARLRSGWRRGTLASGSRCLGEWWNRHRGKHCRAWLRNAAIRALHQTGQYYSRFRAARQFGNATSGLTRCDNQPPLWPRRPEQHACSPDRTFPVSFCKFVGYIGCGEVRLGSPSKFGLFTGALPWRGLLVLSCRALPAISTRLLVISS